MEIIETTKDIPKEIQIKGYSIDTKTGKETRKTFTIDSTMLTREELLAAIMVTLNEYDEYQNPVLLSDSELWDELETLCTRFLDEKQCVNIALKHCIENIETNSFIPDAFKQSCETMLKIRECIDEIERTECMCAH